MKVHRLAINKYDKCELRNFIHQLMSANRYWTVIEIFLVSLHKIYYVVVFMLEMQINGRAVLKSTCKMTSIFV